MTTRPSPVPRAAPDTRSGSETHTRQVPNQDSQNPRHGRRIDHRDRTGGDGISRSTPTRPRQRRPPLPDTANPTATAGSPTGAIAARRRHAHGGGEASTATRPHPHHRSRTAIVTPMCPIGGQRCLMSPFCAHRMPTTGPQPAHLLPMTCPPRGSDRVDLSGHRAIGAEPETDPTGRLDRQVDARVAQFAT